MSSSSKIFGDHDSSKVELPVFVTPNELVFSANKRRTLLTVFNPYGSEAHFKIMTTNPDRFDVSISKGTIKPNRRIDITIRLVSNKNDELPEATDEPQLIDHFRISIQVATLRGNRQIKVHWCAIVDYSDNDEGSRINLGSNAEDKIQRVKIKSSKQPLIGSPSALSNTCSSSSFSQRNLPQQSRSLAARSSRSQLDHPANNGSNINLVCFLCAIICVIPLFLPLAIDSELCKKAKLYSENNSNSQSTGMIAQFSNFLSVSYEMKFGCSFALGLFTYRLISTMPD